MATRSIIHSVHIQQKEHAKAFVAALERAQMKKKKDVVISKAVNELPVDQIKKYFGE